MVRSAVMKSRFGMETGSVDQPLGAAFAVFEPAEFSFDVSLPSGHENAPKSRAPERWSPSENPTRKAPRIEFLAKLNSTDLASTALSVTCASAFSEKLLPKDAGQFCEDCSKTVKRPATSFTFASSSISLSMPRGCFAKRAMLAIGLFKRISADPSLARRAESDGTPTRKSKFVCRYLAFRLNFKPSVSATGTKSAFTSLSV